MVDHPDTPWYRQVDGWQRRAFPAALPAPAARRFDFTIMTFILIDIQEICTVDAAPVGALGAVTLFFRRAGGPGAGMTADRRGAEAPADAVHPLVLLVRVPPRFSTACALLFACRARFGVGGVGAAGMPPVGTRDARAALQRHR